MGTHGIIILHMRGRRYIFWNQYDSYASCLGNMIMWDLHHLYNKVFRQNTEDWIQYIETYVKFVVPEHKDTPLRLYTWLIDEMWNTEKCNYNQNAVSGLFALSLCMKRGYAEVTQIIEPEETSDVKYLAEWEYHIDLDNEEFRVPQLGKTYGFDELVNYKVFDRNDDRQDDDE